jgi:putative effector of murein hydrolase LrgA (UPF0299 family)
VKGIKTKTLNQLATWAMMIALFFNPLGFDVVQYWLILATGNLWRANAALYCIAGLFFGLSILFRILYKKKTYNEKDKII